MEDRVCVLRMAVTGFGVASFDDLCEALWQISQPNFGPDNVGIPHNNLSETQVLTAEYDR